jgi:hypothetical protein
VKRGRRVAWVAFVVWVVLTTTALLVPMQQDRSLFGRGFDKVAHTGMFTVLGVLAQSALPWFSLIFTVPFAIGLEYAQKKVPHRTFDRVELYANVIGVVLGALCGEAAFRLRRS